MKLFPIMIEVIQPLFLKRIMAIANQLPEVHGNPPSDPHHPQCYRPDNDESGTLSLPPPLLPSEPSVIMLETTLVEEPPEMPVYKGVQILDEGQGSC